ncbi:MAG: O-antigen ligase family protein [Syntrophales bacterium]|nr:O-antigen ligase family protein [Syntrophales bacterium]MCK9527542.1 O-antigen ligase family protein [Syntrophales bacterium]MDX9922599.1 O-antigen ligase family protein [Syntrophales bacterium]
MLPRAKQYLTINPVSVAGVLVILLVFAMMVSTAATVIMEVLLLLCVIGFRELRRKTFATLKQPMVVMALVLYFMITLGIIYSVAPLPESVDSWARWRKLFLVPVVAAVYTDPLWKQRFISFFICLSALAALLSCGGFLLGMGTKYGPGILVQNWATQGMLFSVALFACLVLLRFPLSSVFVNTPFLIISAAVLSLNIVLITHGRSGYLTLIVLIMAFIFFGAPKKTKLLFMLPAPVLIVSLLLISPVAHDRVFDGIDELKTYEQAPMPTNMGYRVIAWKNTITLLKRCEHPFFGYGTGGFETAYAGLMNEKQIEGKRRWQDEPIHDPHNQYLIILVDYGLAGLGLFLLFIGAFFIQPINRPYYLLGIGVVLAWCATSLFNGHFGTAIEGRFLLVWCSAMLSADRGLRMKVMEETVDTV